MKSKQVPILKQEYSIHLVIPNPEHVVLSVWISVMVPQVAGVQLVPVVGENPPISKTSLTAKQCLLAMLQNHRRGLAKSKKVK